MGKDNLPAGAGPAPPKGPAIRKTTSLIGAGKVIHAFQFQGWGNVQLIDVEVAKFRFPLNPCFNTK